VTTPEQQARVRIDAMLAEAGWALQDMAQLDPSAGPGVAVREYQTDAGPCDYMLYVGGKPCGVIEAKKEGTTLTSWEAQTRAYATSLPADVPAPVRPLPFLYESTGAETRFTNGLDPMPRSRPVFWFHQPSTLQTWLDSVKAIQRGLPGAPLAPTMLGALPEAPDLDRGRLWPAQYKAVNNLEASIVAGQPRALIQMATGSGKTFCAITALYRLIHYGGARRVLFLVDRGNLGRQAKTAFDGFDIPETGRKFNKTWVTTWLQHRTVDPVNKVVVSTIQRLYSILSGRSDYDASLDETSTFHTGVSVLEPPSVEYSPGLPPDFFDVIVVDECHRSIYTTWRQVLEYFDATIIGLTATPDKRTFGFFNKNLVMEYKHEHAVRDRCNVPFEVYTIRTRITEQGATLVAKDAVQVRVRNRQTRAVRWEGLDEDLDYVPEALDKSVVAIDQIRTIVRELKRVMFTDLFPGRTEIPKILFFAKNDAHAEDILEIVREVFGLGNEQAVKITYKPEQVDSSDSKPRRVSASRRPEALIKAFRNRTQPRIAVTVDMIATGTDIKPLEVVVFMRSVKSRLLFEQMKGRGVRVMNDTDFQAVTPGGSAKTHFVLVDCVGVLEDQPTNPPVIRDRSIPLSKLLRLVAMGNRDEDVLSTLAGRLDRMDRRFTPLQRAVVEDASGGVPLRDIVAGLIDAIDPDREDEKARELYDLAPEATPAEAQLEVAQEELRDAAARPLLNPDLRKALLTVRQEQDQVLDPVTTDEVVKSERSKHLEIDYARELVESFQTYIEENKDQIDALQVLYSQPHGQRLTRKAIRELADAIKLPPRSWTTEALWAAYEKVEQGRVRGASADRLWTDIVALAKHALGVQDELAPFAEQVEARYESWLAQQNNRGRSFDEDQLKWLGLIKQQIVVDVEVVMDDFQRASRFVDAGGMGAAWRAFGEELEVIVGELNVELVA